MKIQKKNLIIMILIIKKNLTLFKEFLLRLKIAKMLKKLSKNFMIISIAAIVMIVPTVEKKIILMIITLYSKSNMFRSKLEKNIRPGTNLEMLKN